MLSSPPSTQPLEANFLARWMPSRHRAGVILNPCVDLASSLRDSWAPRDLEDSLASQFAPLPASSSSFSVDSLSLVESGVLSQPQKSDSTVALRRASGVGKREQDAADESKLKTNGRLLAEKVQLYTSDRLLDGHQKEEPRCLLQEQQNLQYKDVQESGAGTVRWRERHSSGQDDDDSEDWEESAPLENSDQSRSTDTEEKPQELVHSDDRPIKPGVGGRRKTFDELLEEQLRLEEQRLRTFQQQLSVTEELKQHPKRTFLKRGEGLSRFTRGKGASTKKKASAAPPKTSSGGTPEPSISPRCPPIQRKITSLNKENHPQQLPTVRDLRNSENKGLVAPLSRPKALGSHQRQNIAISESRKTKGDHIQPQQQLPKLQASTNQHTRRPEPSSRPDVEQPKKVRALPPQEMPSPAALQPQPEYSFELSFQEKLERWDAERMKESMELGEFELLEQAAEELSFSSNSSFIMQVLQLDRQTNRGHRQFRRLSSTPIKRTGTPQLAEGRGEVPGSTKDGGLHSRCREKESGISGTDGRGVLETDDEEATDASCRSSVVFGDPDNITPQQENLPSGVVLSSSPCFSVTSGALYDKTSYQDRCRNGALMSGQKHDSGGSESTLVEDRHENDEEHFVFDDDDTWNDAEEPEDTEEEEEGGDDNNPVERCISDPSACSDIIPSVLKRKVVAVKGVELGSHGVKRTEQELQGFKVVGQELHDNKLDRGLEPPPISQLVAKLFPSLKPKAVCSVPAAEPPRATAEPDAGPHPLSKQLRERLAELEGEIERFRLENAALAHLKQERETALEALRKEMAEFERRKEEELVKLDEFRKEETRKLQRERKVFEMHASAARALPGRKEREEIQALKQQLSSLQEELRRREARWSNTYSRLRQQLDALSAENGALRDEVRVLEKLRVAAWKKAESEKEAEKGAVSAQDAKKLGTTRSKSVSPTGATRTSPALPVSNMRGSPVSSQPGKSKTNMKTLPVPTPAPKATGQQVSEPLGTTATPSPEMPTTLPSEVGELQTVELCDMKNEEKLHQAEQGSQEEVIHPDGKIETVLPSGGWLIVFPNGTRKEVSADGQTVNITFFNGDVKQITPDQRVIYYYADAQTTHTTYPDGMEVLQFPNNQFEKHFPDGRKEITFPDQTVKNLFPDGKEESIFPDGTIMEVQPDGSKVIRFNNGQREVHTATFKRREYPDGTAKTIYSDGRQETRYPTGRVRIKDKDGRVIVDSRN